MPKSQAQLQAEQAEKLNRIRAEQSALRVESGRRAEAAQQNAEAAQTAERVGRMEYILQLKRNAPAEYYKLSDGERLAASRYEHEQRGLGGRDNRDSGLTYSGFVDPRFPRLRELQATDVARYEAELARLSGIDKMNFGRWLQVQAR